MDLTSLFSGKDRWTRGLFLSFDIFPISFFEDELLSKIIVDENLTVILDQNNWHRILYEDEQKPLRAGVHYNLEGISVKHGGRFHPKLYILEQADEIQLIVGSFNLTKSGFKRNLESGLSIRIRRANWDENDQQLLRQIGDFLSQAFVETNEILSTPSPSLKSAVSQILSSPMFIEARQENTSEKAPYFLHSLNQGLLGQVLGHVGKVTQLEVISPYFDKSLVPLAELTQRCGQIEINTPYKDSTFPRDAFFEEFEHPKNINISAMACEQINIQRFIHAKFYRFHTNDGIWDFATSANSSSAGLITDGYPRNLEVGILYPASDEVFVPEFVTTSRVKSTADLAPTMADPFDLVSHPLDKRASLISSSRYLDRKIRITLSSETQQEKIKARILVNHSDLGEYETDFELGEFFFEPELELSGQDLVQVEIRTEQHEAWSLPVFVSRPKHDPHFLPSLGASEYEKCLHLGGFEGLEKAFRLAAESGREDWLMYLLNHWNLSRILEGKNAEEEDEPEPNVHIPSLNVGKPREYHYRHLARNMDVVFLNSIDFYASFANYVSSVVDESRGDVQRILKFCMPVFTEISRKFFDILKREETKKEQNSEICYPKYTWGHNFSQYKRYGTDILNLLSELAELHPGNDDLLKQTIRWLSHHTAKTLTNLDAPFMRLVGLIRARR